VVLRQLLDLGETHHSQLAESLGMTRGAISKLVDRLGLKGHVVSEADKGDGRYQTVRLTASGRKLVPMLAALADRNDSEFFGHMSKEEILSLIGTLKDIVRRRNVKGVPVG
jgi:DNA-binding MarR family transcriptional regulator